MSTFSGLNTGLTSLYAQRRGLEIAGHNIANVNTEGYSRQRLQLQGKDGPLVPAIHSRWNGTGNGVTTVGVDRLRDVFLESRGVQERGTNAALDGERVLMGRIEAILSEPGDAGLQSQLVDLWTGWDAVANQPDSLAARSELIERAKTLADGINGAVSRLSGQWSASDEQLRASVDEVNATAAAIADYNANIMKATQAGLSPNDLTDQRDLLVQRLGELAGVSRRTGDFGSVDVFLNGTALVRGANAERLKVEGPDAMAMPVPPAVSAVDVAVRVTWERSNDPDAPGYPATVGGALGGMQRGLNEILPTYRDKVIAIGTTVAAQVNGVHTVGAYDQDGNAGEPFFSVAGGKLQVDVTDPRKVAASGTQVAGGDRGGDKAAEIALLASAKNGADDRYRRTIVELGVEAQTANRRVDIQRDILAQVDAARDSEAGVNLDEEMTSMLAYQRAYEGAARYISAVDQVLDTLINRTGVVGR